MEENRGKMGVANLALEEAWVVIRVAQHAPAVLKGGKQSMLSGTLKVSQMCFGFPQLVSHRQC